MNHPSSMAAPKRFETRYAALNLAVSSVGCRHSVVPVPSPGSANDSCINCFSNNSGDFSYPLLQDFYRAGNISWSVDCVTDEHRYTYAHFSNTHRLGILSAFIDGEKTCCGKVLSKKNCCGKELSVRSYCSKDNYKGKILWGRNVKEELLWQGIVGEKWL